ncbi:MAG: tRNA (adenosine(37)-N6)-dimethylallyltransferase MiaA [Lachnospiraceae bacterium]|nr:tRNA (adenosine(37)-N6)-dimethylallyltransferase MiaA [Lachnospiraceae bacterium]MBR3580208.1 tRNA (adenosine(37)-N6)-dimethylallyltransferase MiaA [Lachnospiraceae bacterium]MBR4541621.1 tRNA (adenosine(37)-N6)-dimethylallyltransferase MiaA [Lachnospiraceae bacterium]
MNEKQPLIIITGPTAVGKTALSVETALKLDGEIISADSMQVYRGMDIGTAKIKEEEKKGVPHHLIDIINPDEEFNVTIFKDMAKKCIDDIASRGKIPIIAGGTGFYIQSVLYDVDFTDYDEDKRSEVRMLLEDTLEEKGIDFMYERLKEVDPKYAEVIHKNNIRRVLHGLEYNIMTGNRLSEHNEEQRERTSPYNFLYFVLNDDRAKVYGRINKRVDEMLRDGLADEVRGLLEAGYSRDLQSMQGLGYKEMADYLYGECPYDEAVEIIKRDTRHFAKKQLTWFKRERVTVELNREVLGSDDKILEHILFSAQLRGLI